MKPHTTTLVKIRKGAKLPNGLERYVYRDKDFNVAYVADKSYDKKKGVYNLIFWNGYKSDGSDKTEAYSLDLKDLVGCESALAPSYIGREDY